MKKQLLITILLTLLATSCAYATKQGTTQFVGQVGFFSATPVNQQTGNVCTAMQNLGFISGCTETGGGGLSGLTTNNVPKATSSSALGLSSITDNGNVGIGSVNPGQKLDVQGTVRDLGEIISGNVGIGSTNPGQKLDVQGTVKALFFSGDGSALINVPGSISGLTTNTIPKASSGTTIVNGTIVDNGNIGIGSANPSQKLDVNGTVNATNFTGTTINKVTITAPATSATLTIANSKTLTASNTLTLAGTDATVMTFPGTSATIARTDAANTFTGHQTIEGVTSTGATGTGALVFGTAPTISNPVTTNISPGADFTITQNAVAPFKSVNSGAIVNTLILNAGNVGIGSITPGQALDVNGTLRTMNVVYTTNKGSTQYIISTTIHTEDGGL